MSRAVAHEPPRAGTPRPAAGTGGGLVGRAAPPLRLPGAHFAVALAFWAIGAAGLVWVAPEIASGAFTDPRVGAVTHLFTLGLITTTILGALYQFLPVALGVPIRSERLARATLALYAPGLALFVAGLAAGLPALFLPGAALFGTALLIFVGNLVASLARAPERSLTWWALAAASLFLVATVLLGVALTGNLRWGYLGAERLAAMGVHIHVAIAGWVLMVMTGVAHRLLPMFLLSHGASERPGALAVALLAAGTGALLVLHHHLTPGLVALIGVLIGGGALAFLVQAALFFRHRRKPALDPGMRLAAAGLGFLAVALAMAPFAVAAGVAAPRLATAYVLVLLLGGISLFVAGHYYKILPFLIWFHRFGPLVGKRPVPLVADLYAPGPAGAAAALLAAGVLGLATATLAGAAWAARPAALLFGLGTGIVVTQMWTISRRRPE
jgi:hypothetical protein